MIIIDDREPEKIKNILYKEGVRIKTMRLTIGDYIIGDLGIERKSTYDFYRSIIDKRIFDQTSRLKEAYPRQAIIIEGDIEDLLYTSTNPSAILGTLTSLAVDYSIPLIYSRDEEDTAKILIYIWRKYMKKKGRESLPRYKPRIMNDRERLEFIVQSLPNIGPKLARNILTHYRTLRALFTSSLSELKSIEGVGEKRAQEIYRLITLDYTKLID